jgi:acetyltransferase-like isoleucine patch superfamily enzyme
LNWAKRFITQGVKICVSSVFVLGSVVTKDVKPYSIIIGNTAVLIRKRFDEATSKFYYDHLGGSYKTKK